MDVEPILVFYLMLCAGFTYLSFGAGIGIARLLKDRELAYSEDQLYSFREKIEIVCYYALHWPEFFKQ